MAQQLAELADPLRLARRGLVRVDPERGVDPLSGYGERQGSPARLDSRPDRDDALVTPASRARASAPRGILERVEVRVRVDHAAGAGASIRGKSGAAASIPVAGAVRP